MKQATARVKLSKDQDIVLTGVTPVEALLLTAEHNRNVGGQVIEIVKDTVKDTEDKRGVDDEMVRLRQKYHGSKVDTILSKIREIPTEDFDKACKMGFDLVFPTNKLSATKIG